MLELFACTRRKASINDSTEGTEIVCRLHHLVNMSCEQHVTGWDSGEIADGRIVCPVALSSIFAK